MDGFELLKEQVHTEYKLKGQSKKMHDLFGTLTNVRWRGHTRTTNLGSVQVALVLAVSL